MRVIDTERVLDDSLGQALHEVAEYARRVVVDRAGGADAQGADHRAHTCIKLRIPSWDSHVLVTYARETVSVTDLRRMGLRAHADSTTCPQCGNAPARPGLLGELLTACPRCNGTRVVDAFAVYRHLSLGMSVREKLSAGNRREIALQLQPLAEPYIQAFFPFHRDVHRHIDLQDPRQVVSGKGQPVHWRTPVVMHYFVDDADMGATALA